MSYWATGWPAWFAVLSVPVLLFVLVFFALSRRRSRWKAVLCAVSAYLVVANLAGLFVYQWIPVQYTRDQNWSWPPTSNSLGLVHGKRLSVAAGRGIPVPRSVREEQADYFRRWLMGPTLAGLVLVALAVLAARLYRWLGSRDRKKGFARSEL